LHLVVVTVEGRQRPGQLGVRAAGAGTGRDGQVDHHVERQAQAEQERSGDEYDGPGSGGHRRLAGGAVGHRITQ
jgi:hypothetical protein